MHKGVNVQNQSFLVTTTRLGDTVRQINTSNMLRTQQSAMTLSQSTPVSKQPPVPSILVAACSRGLNDLRNTPGEQSRPVDSSRDTLLRTPHNTSTLCQMKDSHTEKGSTSSGKFTPMWLLKLNSQRKCPTSAGTTTTTSSSSSSLLPATFLDDDLDLDLDLDFDQPFKRQRKS